MASEERDWEDLGSAEPYFAVLTEGRFLRENLTEEAIEEFYASGQRDIEMLLNAAAMHEGALPRRSLEFGCGVGRLTLALARLGTEVVGIDSARSMLSIARAKAAADGLTNVVFATLDELEKLEPKGFDFVFSYIVFQHMPAEEGEQHAERLLRLAAPGATAALHFTLGRRGSCLRRLLRRVRSRSRILNLLVQAARGERRLPYIQMNEYDERRLRRLFAEAGFDAPTVVPTDHGGIVGGIFIARRVQQA